MKLMGYIRKDGSIGIRNKVLILPTVSCSAETAKIISNQVKNTVTVNNQLGCGQIGSDAKRTINTLIGTGRNPNIYGVIVVGLGCETAQAHAVAEGIKSSGKPVETVVIQEEGGTINAVAKGVRLAAEMTRKMSKEKRIECDLSNLIIALECGGSDPTSGIASNPALGRASDLIIKNGGTVILSETTELIGAEHILAHRVDDPKIGENVVKIVNNMEELAKQMGGNLRGGNPAPGNIVGGITTIEEKSLGCIYKGGTTPVMEVVEYAERPSQKGLIIMDSPGFDVDSVTGMVAAGAQICVFTTGRGTPVGNSIVPVIKVTGNPITYEKMKDNIDIDVSSILEGKNSIEEMGNRIFSEILEVANGKTSKAETLGFSEFSIWRCGISV